VALWQRSKPHWSLYSGRWHLVTMTTVTCVVGRMRPRRSVLWVPRNLLTKWNFRQEKNNTEFNDRTVSLCKTTLHTNKEQDPTQREGKGLPKYDPQSETTIDSYLWLGTTLGQKQRNKEHRMPTQITEITSLVWSSLFILKEIEGRER
jgi:hypothetical protein